MEADTNGHGTSMHVPPPFDARATPLVEKLYTSCGLMDECYLHQTVFKVISFTAIQIRYTFG